MPAARPSSAQTRWGRTPGRLTRASLLVALAAAIGGGLAHPTAAALAAPTEREVKAAFIYNFAKFIDWPASRRAPGAVTLCILGADLFGASMDSLSGKPVGAAAMRVRRLAAPEDSAGCDMLFLPNEQADRLAAALNGAKGSHLITVGETPGLAERGATINFYLEQDRVRFEVNVDAAARTGVPISSQLLRLARIVHDRTPVHD